jgi:hypothetical protein
MTTKTKEGRTMAQQHHLGTRATNVSTREGTTYVRYHATDVVAFNQTTITLRSGGWRTQTTKNRMNQAASQFDLGFTVFQKDFDWFVDLPNGKRVDFAEGMQIAR